MNAAELRSEFFSKAEGIQIIFSYNKPSSSLSFNLSYIDAEERVDASGGGGKKEGINHHTY